MSARPTYPVAMMQTARRLREAGWPWARIQDLVEAEHGRRPSYGVVRRWCDENYRLRHNKSASRYSSIRKAREATFRLGGGAQPSEVYRDAFIRRLLDEGVTAAAVVRVCRVVLPDTGVTEDLVRTLRRSADTARRTVQGSSPELPERPCNAAGTAGTKESDPCAET